MDDINVKDFTRMLKDAGLDFTRKADVALFDAACGEYTGDNITRDIGLVIAKAASKKSAADTLNSHFDNFREQERAKNPTITPQPKEEKDQSAFEGLEKYFSQWRKSNIKKEG